MAPRGRTTLNTCPNKQSLQLMNLNPLAWPPSHRQLLFVLFATTGFAPSAYIYWQSDGELLAPFFIFISSWTIFLIVSIATFTSDSEKTAR